MKEEVDRWVLKQRSAGRVVAKMKATSMITPDTPYGVLVLFDGSNFQLFIDNILVLTLPAAATPNGTVGFQVKGTSGTFDEIVVN